MNSTGVLHHKKWLSKSRAGLLTQSQFAKGATHLYGKLKHLGSKRSQRSGNYYQCNGTDTDIFSLPVELLAEIFFLANLSPPHIYDRTSTPLNLTQTCRLWRAISLGTPQLWNTLWIYLDVSPKNLELLIDRANGLPLDLDVSCLDRRWSKDEVFGRRRETRLWDIVKFHAAKVERLRFSSTFAHSTFLASLKPGMFAGLRSVEWLTEHTRSGPMVARNYEGFWENACSAPLLRKVGIQQIPEKAPWSQLNHLQLVDSPFLPVVRALSQCHNLTKLSWSLCDMHTTLPAEPYLLPKLVHLSVAFGNVSTASLFEWLTLPSLSRICVNWCNGNMLESLHRLLARSNATLTSFQASYLPSREVKSLIKFLDAPLLCNFQSLSIHVFDKPGRFWAALAAGAFLPCLQALRLGIHKANNPNDIETSLRLRQQAGKKLTQVVLSIYGRHPYPDHTAGGEDAYESARGGELWDTGASKLSDLLVVVVPWSRGCPLSL